MCVSSPAGYVTSKTSWIPDYQRERLTSIVTQRFLLLFSPFLPVNLFSSSRPSSLSSSLPGDTEDSTRSPSHHQVILLSWLCARPHGCRRSCPTRDRVFEQFTTGRKTESILMQLKPINQTLIELILSLLLLLLGNLIMGIYNVKMER